jgi:type VI secretion system protein VasG
MKLSIKALISKFDKQSTQCLENAVKLCVNKKVATVEIEHWILTFLQAKDSVFYKILDESGINLIEFLDALQITFAGLENRSTSQTPSFSKPLTNLFHDSWMIASVEYSAGIVSSGHILMTILKNYEAFGLSFRLKNILKDIDVAQVHQALEKLHTEGKAEQVYNSTQGESALLKFTTDLTAQAKAAKLDRAIGRTSEINQIIDVLCRRKQNNPIIVGEAGVGKTAIIEELAVNIANNNIPDSLKNASIKILDLAALTAGASVKGEFEDRLKQIIKEVKTAPNQIILFIDEIHNMLGAGSATAGQNDAANLLKPELAKGELKVIGATTWAEYKKFFEKDAALNRRFQVIKVSEPTEQEAIQIVKNTANLLETHHNVQILDSAIISAVKLSIRYLSHLRLPDKAITLLDSACSKVRLMHNVSPVSLSNLEEQLRLLKVDLERCKKNFMDLEANNRVADLVNTIQEKEQYYKKQKDLHVQKVQVASEMKMMDVSQKEEYFAKKQILASMDLDSEMCIYPYVNKEVIADVLSDWTNIPIKSANTEEEVAELLSLDAKIKQRVIGQDHAVDKIVQTIQISKANMGDERKPIGVFFLVGESGTGKTETALSIAETIYKHENKMITINMSEYKEAHKISTLIGSPPGYVGYGEGGRLTEAVRKNPYSVILLDEIEKAHSDVQDLFLQVFDKGMLKDSEGVQIDFKNTIIIMTSNAGAKKIGEFCKSKSKEKEVNDNVNSSDAEISGEEGKAKTQETNTNQLKDNTLNDENSEIELEAEEQSDALSEQEKLEHTEIDKNFSQEKQEDSSHLKCPNDKQNEQEMTYLTDEELLDLKEIIDAELLKHFKPEFLGRVVTLPYVSLTDNILKHILKLQFAKINKKLTTFYNATFVYDDEASNFIIDFCKNSVIGARAIEQMIQTEILPDLSLALLDLSAKQRTFKQVSLSYSGGAFSLNVQGVEESLEQSN